MKRFLTLALCFAICLGLLSGCSDKKPPVEPEKPEVQDPKPPEKEPAKPPVKPADPVKEPEKPSGIINPLTGLGVSTLGFEEKALRKPVAIMMGNSSDALPQLGVSTADIIIEMMAEGGTTRFMGLWQDPSGLTKVGSIRSARPYFIDMAQGFDAIFIHNGGSVPAYEIIEKRKKIDLVKFDGIRGPGTDMFFRDEARLKTYKYEHTLITTGAKIEAQLAKTKGTARRDEKETAFNFDKEHGAKNGTAMTKLTVDYFTMNKPSFTYDSNSKLYKRSQYGKENYDGEFKKNVEVKNIILLEMPLAPVPNDPLKIIEVQTTGSGVGKYFCDGKYIEIKWSKESYIKPLVLKDKDGNALKICPGNTFIEVIKTGGKTTIE